MAHDRATSRDELSRQIGARLRALRTARDFTLRVLGAAAQVSPSLLSQIESGQVLPSIETLYRLASALAVPVTEFIPAAPNRAHSPVVRAAERHRIELDRGIVWESLLPEEERGVQLVLSTYPPGVVSGDTYLQHKGRDFFFVLAGELTIELAFDTHDLQPGDSIIFEGAAPHRLSNTGSVIAQAISLIIEPEAVEPLRGASANAPGHTLAPKF